MILIFFIINFLSSLLYNIILFLLEYMLIDTLKINY